MKLEIQLYDRVLYATVRIRFQLDGYFMLQTQRFLIVLKHTYYIIHSKVKGLLPF